MAARQNNTVRNTDNGNRRQGTHANGQPWNKDKYNNRKGGNRTNGYSGTQQSGNIQQQPQISQRELCDFLTEKLRANNFVEVDTKEITNDRGVLYEIDVKNPGLFRIGNSTFYSMKLHTVSHKSRVIFIRIIFNDDDVRNADMKRNADSIIQIFRELAPDTIDSISITDVEDSKGSKHLAVLASTIKGASLNYTYERTLQFVHVIDEKYGIPSDSADGASATNLTTDQIDAEEALLEKKLKALQELKRTKQSNNSSSTTPSYASATASSTTIASSTTAATTTATTTADNDEITTEEQPTSRPNSPSKITIKIGDKIIKVNHGKN